MGNGSGNISKQMKPRRLLSRLKKFGAKISGNRATHIDGALAEDALRASDVLKSTPYTLFDAARLVAHANKKLEPYSVRIDDAINEHVAAIERRRRSISSQPTCR